MQEEYTAKRKEISKKQKETSEKVEKSSKKNKKKKSKKTNIELYEEYLEMKDKAKKTFREKPLWREVLETILAGVIVYIVYLLIFTK